MPNLWLSDVDQRPEVSYEENQPLRTAEQEGPFVTRFHEQRTCCMVHSMWPDNGKRWQGSRGECEAPSQAFETWVESTYVRDHWGLLPEDSSHCHKGSKFKPQKWRIGQRSWVSNVRSDNDPWSQKDWTLRAPNLIVAEETYWNFKIVHCRNGLLRWSSEKFWNHYFSLCRRRQSYPNDV